jgi:hypothetical protein
MRWDEAPALQEYPAAGTPAGPAWKIPPEVQTERDRTRLALLNEEATEIYRPQIAGCSQ